MRLSRLLKPAFVYPIAPAPRTALLSAVFRTPLFKSAGKVRVFGVWGEAAARFKPQAMAGTIAQLEALPPEIVVTHGVIVVGRWEDARVTEVDRERLWGRFRVPMFEQVVNEDGRLLAAECEGHCGLHIVEGAAAGPGEIDESACGCGKTSSRFVPREDAAFSSGASAGGL